MIDVADLRIFVCTTPPSALLRSRQIRLICCGGVSAPGTFRTVKNFRGVRHLLQFGAVCRR